MAKIKNTYNNRTKQATMNEQIKQIGERLRGLREVLDIPAEEVAQLCDISLEHYMKIEDGQADRKSVV